MIVGIMGKVGSGKSEVTKLASECFGAKIFICDDVAKEIMNEPNSPYKSIGDKLFTDENEQEFIRTNFHNIVFNRIYENINKIQSKTSIPPEKQLFVIETALPNEQFIGLCYKTIFVYNDIKVKSKLLKENRKYTDEKIKQILASQKYYEKFYEKADYSIENNGSIEELLEKAYEVFDEICLPFE